MEEIIAPINKEILKAELTEDKRLRFTNKSHNEIYVITYQDSPNVMKEIGRLREIAFRAAGGVQENQWILMSMTLWRIPISSWWYGIRKLKKYWVAIVIC